MEKRYKVEFSGKAYPEYRPTSVTMRAPSPERAKEWADKQLHTWNVPVKAIKVKITEVAEEASQEAAEKKAKKAAKKKTKKEGVSDTSEPQLDVK